MCCKGKKKKCFGEWSRLVVRLNGIVDLLSVDALARTLYLPGNRPVIELLGPSGWCRATRITRTGYEEVYQLPDWPLFLTRDHEINDVRAQFIYNAKAIRHETVYEIALEGESTAIIGPYRVNVTKETEPCEETSKRV